MSLNTAQRVVLILGGVLIGFVLLYLIVDERRYDSPLWPLALTVPVALIFLGVSPRKWWS